MCDFGGPEHAEIGRYDFQYAWDPLWQKFFSPQNARYLSRRFKELGYPEVCMSHLKPYMVEVYSALYRTGFDPTHCNPNQFCVENLNRELIEYVVPIFENFKMSMRNYVMDQKYFRPHDRPIDTSCDTRSLLYNNRFL